MPVKTSLRLLTADLHYPDELKVHTAASGPVAALRELYLLVERSDGFSAIGEVRANIAYLTHLPEEAVAPAIRELCRRLPWSAPPEEIIARNAASGAPSLVRAAVENALVEGIARARGEPVAVTLGGAWRPSVETNQCLFWGPDDQFDSLAERYVREGFRHLKVRIGVGAFEADLARLKRLRDRFGDGISVAVDANGSWSSDEAREKLGRLAAFGLSYVEQPTAPGDWDAFETALSASPVPLMLDEGLKSDADIERLARIGRPAMAHLKIVKLGGPKGVVAAAKKLSDAGVDCMIGQMNEGGLATALTVHCTMAANPAHAELYGSYGLLDDPAGSPSYRDGHVGVPEAPGLGVGFDPARCTVLWSEELT